MKNGHRNEKLEKTIQCIEPGCTVLFTNDSNMRHHYRVIHQQPKKYTCPECGETFKRKQVLKRHRITHTGVFPYVCTTCGHGSTNLKESKRHETSHNAARPRTCTDCGKSFNSWSALVAHRQVALHAIEFKCDHCGRVFPAKSSLKYHVEIHREKESREVIECPYDQCPRFYFEKRNLMAHIRSKHEGIKFICGFDNNCGRSLASKATLVKHLKNHVAERDGLRPASRPPSRNTNRTKDRRSHKLAVAPSLAGLEEKNRDVHRLLLANQGNRVIVDIVNTADELNQDTC